MTRPTILPGQSLASIDHIGRHNDAENISGIVINVKSYGAVGDGVIDDTTAIQTALDTGFNVFVPPTANYYKVTGVSITTPGLRMHSNGQTIFGAGYGSRIHNSVVNSPVIYVGDLPYENNTTVYTGVTIRDLRLTQTMPHTADDYAAINMRSVYGGSILNNWFDSFRVAFSVNQRNITDIAPEACIISGNHVFGDSNASIATEMGGAKGCLMTDNVLIGTSTTAVGLRSFSGLDNEILDNYIRGWNSGISIQGSSPSIYLGADNNTRVAGNRVVGTLGTFDPAIILTNGVEDAVIEDNYLDDFFYGVWLKNGTVGGTKRAVVRNNHGRSSAQTSIYIFIDPPASGFINEDPTVVGNTSRLTLGGKGILLDQVTGDSLITDNVLYMPDNIAINHINSPAGAVTISRRNTIIGPGVSQSQDNWGSGSGKFINYNSYGIDDNVYQSTNGNDFPRSISSPAQITGTVNDYDPLFGSDRDVSIWRLDFSVGPHHISGIAGGWSGRRLTLINISANSGVLENQGAGSTNANKVITGTGADITIAADGRVHLIYDDTTARWRVV